MDPAIPAWALDADAAERNRVTARWPHSIPPDWVLDSDGAGVRVCVIDSGIHAEHPAPGAWRKARQGPCSCSTSSGISALVNTLCTSSRSSSFAMN